MNILKKLFHRHAWQPLTFQTPYEGCPFEFWRCAGCGEYKLRDKKQFVMTDKGLKEPLSGQS